MNWKGDDIVPDPEVGLRYDEPGGPEDGSDDSDSDFEALDFYFEDVSDISFLGVPKMPHKRTSRVDTRFVDNPEAVKQMLFAAAAEASIREGADVRGGTWLKLEEHAAAARNVVCKLDGPCSSIVSWQ